MDEKPATPATPAPSATPAGNSPSPSAAAAAGDALTAAQEAVKNLKTDAAASPGAASPEVIKAAEAAIAQARAASQEAGRGATKLDLPNMTPTNQAAAREAIELLADVNLHVKIELGRTRMLVEDVLRLGEGSVVELDKLAGDPVDVYVNDRPVARGEVLVLNDNFCVRINEILSSSGDGRAA